MSTRAETAAEAPGAVPVPPGSRPHCLLCGEAHVDLVDTFTCRDLEKAWRVFDVSFSRESWSVFDGRSQVELFRCSSCGFQFCDPRLAGGGQFYAELERQKTVYYPPEVPEFVRTVRWARQRQRRTLLDIGCGEGAFLDLARSAGMSVTGVELNLQAAEVCRGKGHTVQTRPLKELLGDGTFPRFDLVTIFQVLEHVSDPVGFLTDAAQLLRPGGILSVAVPNESGVYRLCPKEPHQWPPHHITRWRLRDLRRLGQRCGLEIVHIGANRLLGCEGAHFWKVHNQIASAIGGRLLPGGKALPAVLSFLYRKLGFRYFVSGLGTSVYALYQRRSA